MHGGRFIQAAAMAAALLLGAATTARAGHMAHSKPEVRVGILLFDGVEPIDYVGPYEVFAQAGFGVVTITEDGKPASGLGLAVTPDHSFANAPPLDVLLVPGGDVEAAMKDEQVLAFVRERSAKARHVMSVCTGAYILAAAGLLDGLEATTFHNALKDLAANYPKIKVRDDVRWADNGKIVTSAGLASGIDTALHVVSRVRDVDAARSAALHLEYAWSPDGGFIRGRMADRYFPDFKKVAWPGDAKFERVVSLGDERAWRIRSRITTSASSDDLLKRIDETLGKSGEWTAAGAPHRWRRATDAGTVELALAGTPDKNAGTVDLDASITVSPASSARPKAP